MAYDLKKESDVKEYLDKLGVEYRFGCYSEKKPEGKFLVACKANEMITVVYMQSLKSWHITSKVAGGT